MAGGRWGAARGSWSTPSVSSASRIDDATGVPTGVLAEAAKAEGSEVAAAKRFMPLASVHRAVAFELQHAA